MKELRVWLWLSDDKASDFVNERITRPTIKLTWPFIEMRGCIWYLMTYLFSHSWSWEMYLWKYNRLIMKDLPHPNLVNGGFPLPMCSFTIVSPVLSNLFMVSKLSFHPWYLQHITPPCPSSVLIVHSPLYLLP